MNTRNVSMIFIVVAISLLYSLPLLADAPGEKYHVAYRKRLKGVLKNTIGILTINSGVKKGTELKTYLRTGKRFIYNKVLKVKEETIPVSNFGFDPPIPELYVENYRYPIVAKFDQYLCIVYNAKKNLKAWVNMKEIEKTFYTSVVMLDKIKTPSPFFVDIFCFTKSGRRKVYKEPKKGADYIIISKAEPKYSLLRIIGQKKEFVKIGTAHIDLDTFEESIEPIGWIRLRDGKGILLFWIIDIDIC